VTARISIAHWRNRAQQFVDRPNPHALDTLKLNTQGARELLALLDAAEAARKYREASAAYDEECSSGMTANIALVKPAYELAAHRVDTALARFDFGEAA
jgi:hypothetical protein